MRPVVAAAEDPDLEARRRDRRGRSWRHRGSPARRSCTGSREAVARMASLREHARRGRRWRSSRSARTRCLGCSDRPLPPADAVPPERDPRDARLGGCLEGEVRARPPADGRMAGVRAARGARQGERSCRSARRRPIIRRRGRAERKHLDRPLQELLTPWPPGRSQATTSYVPADAAGTPTAAVASTTSAPTTPRIPALITRQCSPKSTSLSAARVRPRWALAPRR